MKKIVFVLLILLTLGLSAGCGKNDVTTNELQGSVTASGSTALLPLLKPAQEEFQKIYTKVNVSITGGGSFTGMNQVAAGAVDIGNSDVVLPTDFNDKGLVDHQVAVAPFVFIVNTDVSVENLSQQQYVDIFTGKVKNWKDVGGKDEKITIIQRPKSSGSRATIAEVVLKNAAFTDEAVTQDSNGAVRTAVASTPGAIGYVDAAYIDNTVKALNYNGIKYNPDNVINGSYPVFAFEHMYTKGEAKGAVKVFIDYVLSKEFQESYIEKFGFIPITKIKK